MIDIGELNLKKSVEKILRDDGIDTVEQLETKLEERTIKLHSSDINAIRKALGAFYNEEEDISVSLYECANAHVTTTGDRIHCIKKHPLSDGADGTIPIFPLARGKPLIYSACQDCKDFAPMGPSIPQKERGWLMKVKSKW